MLATINGKHLPTGQTFELPVIISFGCWLLKFCRAEHCCNKRETKWTNSIEYHQKLHCDCAMCSERDFLLQEVHTTHSFTQWTNNSTYHLFLLPRFHCGLVLLEFVAPIRIDLLVVGAFVWRRAPERWQLSIAMWMADAVNTKKKTTIKR